MADSKYGRLFTGADLAAITHAARVCRCGLTEAIAKLDAGGIERLDGEGPVRLAFPPDEPLFLLRGQDRFALDGVSGYFDALQAAEDVHADWLVSEEHRDAVAQAGVLLERWQAQHPDRVKAPD